MNRFVPAGIIIIALIAAFLFSRPQPSAPSAPTTTPTFATRVLTGQAISPQAVKNLHVVLLVAGQAVADSAVVNNTYKLELPAQIAAPLTSLKDVQLLHGDGRLPESVLGADTKLVMYNDQNNNKILDSGEPQLEAAFFTPKTNPNLRGFFKYKIVLLLAAASLTETQDSATGAKGYYRYNLPMVAGWNMLEGELASNGYDMRLRNDNTWDIFAALPASGKTSPPVFTPQ